MADLNIQTQTAIQNGVVDVRGDGQRGATGTGALGGYAVTVAEDPVSLLADSAEELTFGVDNGKELELKERKAKNGPGTALLEKVAQYQALMEQAGRSDNLKRLVDFLRDNRDPKMALAKAREWFGGDPSEAWAALKWARDELQDDAPDAALQAIDAALAQLEDEDGARIRAGIFGAVEAGALGAAAGEPFAAGAIYREAACELHDSPEAMFAFIMDEYGPENFETGLDFLFRALAGDLASDEPSHGTTHLEAVGASLGQARILNGAHTLLARLLERWTGVHGIADAQWQPMSLLKEMLDLKADSYLSARSLDTVLRGACAPDAEREVLFMQELLNTARSFSPLFFDGLEGRARFIDAVQEAVDEAVAREDEWLAMQDR